jgi:hypothetical protein
MNGGSLDVEEGNGIRPIFSKGISSTDLKSTAVANGRRDGLSEASAEFFRLLKPGRLEAESDDMNLASAFEV